MIYFLITLKRVYEKLAIGVLNLSYEKSEERAEYLLFTRLKEFSNKTCLQISVSTECLEFLRQQACLNLLKKVWYFKIVPSCSKTKVTYILTI
jgi:hypothetical protein